MGRLILPVTADPQQELSVKLDGQTYTLSLHWNSRSSRWYLDVLDDNGVMLTAGKCVVVGWPLVGVRETDPRLPPGLILAVDTSGQDVDPTLDDFGTRVQLLYMEQPRKLTGTGLTGCTFGKGATTVTLNGATDTNATTDDSIALVSDGPGYAVQVKDIAPTTAGIVVTLAAPYEGAGGTGPGELA